MLTSISHTVQLAREEAQRQLAANSTDTDTAAVAKRALDLRSVWEEMNPRDILYAGEFDQ